MGRARDFVEDAGALLLGFMAVKVLSSWEWPKSSYPEWSKADKGGKGAGPGATTAPVPHGAANIWSEQTMRLFAQEMSTAGIDPRVALLGVAAASNFNSDEALGSYVGLLMVAREDLAALGYPGVPAFEEIDAPHQIPWIARVVAYRIASSGGVAPADVPELAVLLHPSSNPTIVEMLRAEAARRAEEARGKMIYIHHDNLLRHVLANP